MATADLDFLVNLRSSTVSGRFRGKLRPPGYLVAPAYLTAELRRQGRLLSDHGSILVADNGLFDDIGRLSAQLENDHRPGLATRAAALAESVDPARHLEDQLRLKPDAIIGVEDITAALWHRLGLTARTLPNQRTALRSRNRRTVAAAKVSVSNLPPGMHYLPVASAQDYDTAFDAGREFASAGVTGAAIGFGAFMADDSSTSRVKIRGRWRRLPISMPSRYLETALVARGFWEGWRKERNEPPERFHFLGLGAPIMIGIVSCTASATRGITFDATSPIKDAAAGTLYVSKPAYLKIRTWKAAERLASRRGERWLCPCPFCRAFVRKHPFDYEQGLTWARSRRRAVVTPGALRPAGELYEAYPLLGQPSATPLGHEIDLARVGHNHWALKQVTLELAEARRRGCLEAHTEDVVAAYEAATPLHAYAAAVRLAFEIARGAWP